MDIGLRSTSMSEGDPDGGESTVFASVDEYEFDDEDDEADDDEEDVLAVLSLSPSTDASTVTAVPSCILSPISDDAMSVFSLANDYFDFKHNLLSRDCDDVDDSALQRCAAQFSQSEKETVACFSYHYERLSTKADDCETRRQYDLRLALRDKLVLAVLKRHWVAANFNLQHALEQHDRAARFRAEHSVSRLRRCFDNDVEIDLQKQIHSAAKYVRVQGYDEYNHSNILVCAFVDQSVTLDACVFMIEKAIACSEKEGFASQAMPSSENVIVSVDFMGNLPLSLHMIDLARNMKFLFQEIYPGRLWCVYFVNAPWILRLLWILVRIFLTGTACNLHFVSGVEHCSTVCASVESDLNLDADAFDKASEPRSKVPLRAQATPLMGGFVEDDRVLFLI